MNELSADDRRRGNAGKGRRKGTPNKATADSRAAIALFVDRNTPRLQKWLDKIANGVKREQRKANEPEYVVDPNPVKAFELVQSMLEFHVPKMQRTEFTGPGGAPLPGSSTNVVVLGPDAALAIAKALSAEV